MLSVVGFFKKSACGEGITLKCSISSVQISVLPPFAANMTHVLLMLVNLCYECFVISFFQYCRLHMRYGDNFSQFALIYYE